MEEELNNNEFKELERVANEYREGKTMNIDIFMKQLEEHRKECEKGMNPKYITERERSI